VRSKPPLLKPRAGFFIFEGRACSSISSRGIFTVQDLTVNLSQPLRAFQPGTVNGEPLNPGLNKRQTEILRIHGRR